MASIGQRPPNINPARQNQQIEQKTNLITMLFSTFQNIQKAFTYTILTVINFFTSLPFKIMQKILYFLQKGARYLLWINIKGLVSSANLIYRFFAFFRVNKVVTLLQMIAKTYFPQYSMVDFNRAEQNISRFSLIMRKKNYDLINVDKFQKKVKTPTLFALYTKKRKEGPHQVQDQNVQSENQDMVRQRNQQENGNQSVSPRLVRLSQSHEKIKKGSESRGPAPPRGGDLRVEIPRERNVSDNRVFPDRDISPQRYMKPIPKIGEQVYHKQGNDYQNEGDNQIPPYPFVGESEFARQSRQQLEKQLLHLRGKMQQLIEDNTNYIRDLQEWLRQKSETVMMTRTENIQLLQQMQQLQKQNIKKTQKLQNLQERVKQMEDILQKQKSQTGELCYQIVKLNEEIQQKSIELVVLKDKINRSLKKFQQNQEALNLKDTQQKPQKLSDQLYDQGQTLQDKIALAKLRRQEKKTEQLAQKVQKVLREERKRLESNENEIDEPNLIMNDPRQVQGSEYKQSSQNKGEKKTRKKSQPRVLKQEGNSKITMSME